MQFYDNKNKNCKINKFRMDLILSSNLAKLINFLFIEKVQHLRYQKIKVISYFSLDQIKNKAGL